MSAYTPGGTLLKRRRAWADRREGSQRRRKRPFPPRKGPSSTERPDWPMETAGPAVLKPPDRPMTTRKIKTYDACGRVYPVSFLPFLVSFRILNASRTLALDESSAPKLLSLQALRAQDFEDRGSPSGRPARQIGFPGRERRKVLPRSASAYPPHVRRKIEGVAIPKRHHGILPFLQVCLG